MFGCKTGVFIGHPGTRQGCGPAVMSSRFTTLQPQQLSFVDILTRWVATVVLLLAAASWSRTRPRLKWMVRRVCGLRVIDRSSGPFFLYMLVCDAGCVCIVVFVVTFASALPGYCDLEWVPLQAHKLRPNSRVGAVAHFPKSRWRLRWYVTTWVICTIRQP